MIVTLHDKSTNEGQGIVHLRGEENGGVLAGGSAIQIALAGSAALADSFEAGVSYEVTIAKK